jgi:NADPH2:quinone reductase
MSVPKSMRAWRVHEYGQPNDVLQLDEVPVPEPGTGELLVRVQAIPLNLNDMERITGRNMMVRPELPSIPGMEVMGVVDGCGEGALGWQGKRVVALPKQANGGFAEYARCPVESTFEMPEEIPLPDAAALYFPFHLAWLGLVDRADLRAGERVLIHAAAGGSGSAAIQIAKHAGARVFATASSEAKLKLCRELGADVTINYQESDFSEIVLDETEGRGVDVIFDNVGKSVMEKSVKCIAYNGRYLMMGFASDKSVVDQKFIVPRGVLAGNFKLCGVMLAYASEAVAPVMKRGMGWNFVPDQLGERIMREINDLVLSKRVKPVIGHVADFEGLPAALEALARRETVGRTIVRLW